MRGGAPKKNFFHENALSGSIHSTYQLPSMQTYQNPTLGQPNGQPAIVLVIFFCSPRRHGRRIRMLSCSTLHNCATFRKPPGFYKSVAHFYSCLHSDIRLHTLAQYQINSKLGKYYYLSYLLLHRQKTESNIWVNMCSRELQTECSGVFAVAGQLDTAA